MRTYIEMVRDQAATALTAKTREKVLDRPLKPQNPDLYYGHLHLECYFYQQYEGHSIVAGLLGHRRVSFAACFLMDYILNQ